MTDENAEKKPLIARLRGTWEYKSIAVLLRIFVAGFVLLYAMIALPAIWGWGQAWYIRQQPAAEFTVLLDQAKTDGDYDWALKWLYRRPQAEEPQHAATIEARAAELPAGFFAYNKRAAQQGGDADSALFWSAYQRYRLRFDLLRCGNTEVIDRTNQIMGAMSLLQKTPDPVAAIQDEPARMAPLLQRVLDFDADHPAANDPAMTCRPVLRAVGDKDARPVPREGWDAVRYMLRMTTDQAIHDMRRAGERPKAAHRAKGGKK